MESQAPVIEAVFHSEGVVVFDDAGQDQVIGRGAFVNKRFRVIEALSER